MTKSQMRGYLYEILISHLLIKNNFRKCIQNNDGTSDCGLVSADGEIQGRGTKHQIDFVGIYTNNIPFVFPIRLLAECKYWKRKVDKSFIRAYVGVHKDISENYLSSEMDQKNRFLDIPIIFSANDFDKEAVKLAWAQGINLVSHSRLPLLQDILNFIKAIVDSVPENLYPHLKSFVQEVINNHVEEIPEFIEIAYAIIDYGEHLTNFPEYLISVRDMQVQTFLFATNERGMLINLISQDLFPDSLFIQSNSVDCMVYFDDENSDDNERVFYITLNEDTEQRKFYFQANNELMRKGFQDLSLEDRMTEKMNYFSELSIMKNIDGLQRLIKLKVNIETVQRNIIVE